MQILKFSLFFHQNWLPTQQNPRLEFLDLARAYSYREIDKLKMLTELAEPCFRTVHYFYRVLEQVEVSVMISISFHLALLKS